MSGVRVPPPALKKTLLRRGFRVFGIGPFRRRGPTGGQQSYAPGRECFRLARSTVGGYTSRACGLPRRVTERERRPRARGACRLVPWRATPRHAVLLSLGHGPARAGSKRPIPPRSRRDGRSSRRGRTGRRAVLPFRCASPATGSSEYEPASDELAASAAGPDRDAPRPLHAVRVDRLIALGLGRRPRGRSEFSRGTRPVGRSCRRKAGARQQSPLRMNGPYLL